MNSAKNVLGALLIMLAILPLPTYVICRVAYLSSLIKYKHEKFDVVKTKLGSHVQIVGRTANMELVSGNISYEYDVRYADKNGVIQIIRIKDGEIMD